MRKSLEDVLLAAGDPAVETDLLPIAGQVSYGPEPGESCKEKKQVKKARSCLHFILTVELPTTKKYLQPST